jgi:hypothetical protein
VEIAEASEDVYAHLARAAKARQISVDSMTIRTALDLKDVVLVEEAIRNHRPEILSWVDVRLQSDEIEEIREIVGSELVDTGFNPDDTPNDRGRALENLIDELYHLAYP